MTNAEAQFNKSLRPRKPEGSLGWTAQDGHLDSHTAPELWASTLMTYLYIYHQTLQNVICLHMTLHTTGKSLKSITQIQKTQQLCLDHIWMWCNTNHMLINPVKTKSVLINTWQKHQLSDLSLRLSLDGQNIENATEHCPLVSLLTANFDGKPRSNTYMQNHVKNCFFLSSLQHNYY